MHEVDIKGRGRSDALFMSKNICVYVYIEEEEEDSSVQGKSINCMGPDALIYTRL